MRKRLVFFPFLYEGGKWEVLGRTGPAVGVCSSWCFPSFFGDVLPAGQGEWEGTALLCAQNCMKWKHFARSGLGQLLWLSFPGVAWPGLAPFWRLLHLQTLALMGPCWKESFGAVFEVDAATARCAH